MAEAAAAATTAAAADDDDDAEKGCVFEWNVYNPFVPWRKLEATFFHGSPTATPWIVTLQPVVGGLNWWEFIFSLQCVPSGESDIIVVDRLKMYTKLDSELPYVREETVYSFRTENRHAYAFHVTVSCHPHLNIDHLQIAVEISPRSQHIANEEGNGLAYRNEDLERLSKDLKRLYANLNYFDLSLNSTDPRNREEPNVFLVHSCILQARWCNFFREHPAIVDYTVGIDVSEDLLSEILTYMYSGRLFSAEVLDDEKAMTELLRLIDRYKLHHLYQVFVRDDSRHERCTRREWEKHAISFHLDDPESPPSRNFQFPWNVESNTGSEFIFQIEFLFGLDDRPFSYSLQSRSPVTMYARVNLEFVRKSDEDEAIYSIVHARDYKIDSGETIESGTCYFEGHCSEFDDFIERRSEAEFRHSVRCVLCLSGETTVIVINRVDEFDVSDYFKGFYVLSDHMYELQRQKTRADLRVVCRSINPDNPPEIHLLHKAIFAARVPNWKAVLENIPDDEEFIPDEVTCICSSEAFRYVIDYIYTGKFTPIKGLLFTEANNFTVLGDMTSFDLIYYHFYLNSKYPPWF